MPEKETDDIVKAHEFPSGSIVLDNSKRQTLSIRVGSHNLSDFLPEGYRLRFSEYSVCKHEEKAVEVSGRDFETPGFLLEVLHEIGHSKKDTPDDLLRDKQISAELKALPRGEHSDAKYVEIMEEYARIVEGRERAAWLSALDSLKQLLAMGFDVRKNFADFNEFLSSILRHYDSYRSGMKYMFERSGRGSDAQWKGYEYFVNTVFDPGTVELKKAAFDFWNLGKTEHAEDVAPEVGA